MLANLEEEERLERQMIQFCANLLEAGVERHLPPEKRLSFNQRLKLLLNESEKHQRIISTLIEKYEKK